MNRDFRRKFSANLWGYCDGKMAMNQMALAGIVIDSLANLYPDELETYLKGLFEGMLSNENLRN